MQIKQFQMHHLYSVFVNATNLKVPVVNHKNIQQVYQERRKIDFLYIFIFIFFPSINKTLTYKTLQLKKAYITRKKQIYETDSASCGK